MFSLKTKKSNKKKKKIATCKSFKLIFASKMFWYKEKKIEETSSLSTIYENRIGGRDQ